LERLSFLEDGTIVAVDEDRVVGACTPRFDLLTVHPGYRRRGHGRRLVAAARALVGRQGLAELQLWGELDREPGGSFIRALGFSYRSSLWLFRLSPGRVVPTAVFPAGVAVRPIEVGTDDSPYLALISAAFADHPSPLQVSASYVRQVHASPDFDPTDVLIVRPADDPTRLIGFCRSVERPPEGDRRRGDIALVGLLPEWRGRGLGRQLLRWGVTHLRDRGVDEIELSVEARNVRALELYRSEGFEPAVEWPHWVLPAS
jgi:mycothiol synthase